GCETHVSSDARNCGACNNICQSVPPPPFLGCSRGLCVITTCGANFADCDGNAKNGCETNLLEDAAHCGACPNACALANSLPACRAGRCVPNCLPGFADCNGDPIDGCERNLLTDVGYCGACNIRCEPANATPACKR